MSYVVRITGISGTVFWIGHENGADVSPLNRAKRFPSKIQGDAARDAYFAKHSELIRRLVDVDVIPIAEAQE